MRAHPLLPLNLTRRLGKHLRAIADILDPKEIVAPPALVHPPESGWMPEAIRVLTPHRYHAGYKPERVRPVEMIAVHYTASPPGKGPQGADLRRIRSWARGERGVSSTHFVLLRDGRIVQMAPLHDRPWHIQSRFPAPLDERGDINSRAFAMDFENVGWLKGKPGQLKNAYGQRHKAPAAQAPDGTWWEAFTDAQLKSAERVMRFFGQAAPHLRDQKPGRVIRHTQAQPTRPDPGPLCDMQRLRAALLANSEIADLQVM